MITESTRNNKKYFAFIIFEGCVSWVFLSIKRPSCKDFGIKYLSDGSLTWFSQLLIDKMHMGLY